ncbi:MAG TPA: transposase [Actinophytocola sp.]|jgi:putative transposase|uniref:RNA-guided endonuclease InsQ/TnpB family protein n=1 Tax=Actinophytocola sp. TaxID=1872138 RepID=UPI002DFA8350|nr:transposase [Actinophytocola sp.]
MPRFRLLPTSAQEVVMMEHCAHARFVWNLAVEQHLHWRPGRRSAPNYLEQAHQLTEARRAFDWLRAGSVTVQQQALRDFHQALSYFLGGTHQRPTWRKARVHEGFRQVGVKPEHIARLNRRFGHVWVPKVGWVKFRRSRAVPHGIRSYRITRDGIGRWHIAFAAIPKPVEPPDNGATVGVDRGIVVSAALSTGELLKCPELTLKEAERVVRQQRRLARAKPGSNRRKRVVRSIARLKTRSKDRRTDWVEKTTTDLARRFDKISVERLNVRAMTRSARGTSDTPGRNVRAKAGLNRRILTAGWGALLTRLKHKAAGRVIEVDAAYSSQQCSVCGHIAAESRESQARFRCVACGHTGHADLNAARNIDNRGRTTLAARGALQPQGGALNREPQPAPPSTALASYGLESPPSGREDVKSGPPPGCRTTRRAAPAARSSSPGTG